MRPVDFKDEFYDRDPLSSNNDLYVVVKSFYCDDEIECNLTKCKDQCAICKIIEEAIPKQ